MKSIKPGRGPSMMGGLGSIFAGVFGVIWTMAAVQMGAGIFALFGVVFIVFAVLQAVYQFKNATGENRYSEFDITEDGEEPDPLEKRMASTFSYPCSRIWAKRPRMVSPEGREVLGSSSAIRR